LIEKSSLGLKFILPKKTKSSKKKPRKTTFVQVVEKGGNNSFISRTAAPFLHFSASNLLRTRLSTPTSGPHGRRRSGGDASDGEEGAALHDLVTPPT
jgi:hypothetical protein